MDTTQIEEVLAIIKGFSHKKSGETVSIDSLDLQAFKEKKNSPPIWRIVLNEQPLKRNNPYKISYSCPKCDVFVTMNFEIFARKINQVSAYVSDSCQEKMVLERLQCQSCYGKTKVEEIRETRYVSNGELVKVSRELFDKMDSDFQWRYWLHYPTVEEFDGLRARILNGEKLRLGECVYCPMVQVQGGRLFEPRLYYGKDDQLLPVPQLIFSCDGCRNPFPLNTLHQLKGCRYVCTYCKKMGLVVPKLQTADNIVNQKVVYRSHTGLKFIRGCNKRELVVEEGPVISYEYGGDVLRYRVAFSVPKLRLLVLEVDDNNYWVVEQENGIWQAKVRVVEKMVERKEIDSYLIIHSKNKAKVFQDIDKLL